MKKKNANKKLNKFQSIFDYKWFLNDFAKLTAVIPALVFYRMKNIYIDKNTRKTFIKEPCIIVTNHHSFLDPVTCLSHFWYKRTSFLALSKFWEKPFNRFFFTYVFRDIPVDKEKVSINTFKMAKENYNRGHSLVIYPEGTVIHESDAVDPFKSGTIMIASMTQAPIYPAYIVPRKKWYKRNKIVIGNRFDIKDYIQSKHPTSAELNEVTDILYKKEQELELYAKEHHLL